MATQSEAAKRLIAEALAAHAAEQQESCDEEGTDAKDPATEQATPADSGKKVQSRQSGKTVSSEFNSFIRSNLSHASFES